MKGSVFIRNVYALSEEFPELTPVELVVRDGVIVEIAEQAENTTDLPVFDGQGNTLIPGLIDAHFHAYAVALHDDEIEQLPLSYVAVKATQRLRRALQRGFTTVRDVAGGDAGLALAIRQGLLPSPRYFYTGPGLSQTGGHGDPRDGLHETPGLLGGRMTQVVDGPEDLRVVARDLFRRGAHAIKIMTSGGVISLTDPLMRRQFSSEEIRAVAEVAAARGSYVAAHAYSPEAIAHSVANGVRSIEHGNFLNDNTAELMKERHAFLVPTLTAYDAMARLGASIGLNAISQAKNAEVLAAGGHSIEIARRHGVRIGFGSDLMGDLETEQLRGFALQADADGVANTIISATAVNAELIGREDLGHLATGCVADLVVLDGDVLKEPQILWDEQRPRTVFQSGTPISRATPYD